MTTAPGDSPAERPILLAPNQPIRRPYRGGAGIARFRGIALDRDDVPEDFVASVTEVAAGGGVGLTMLDDGRTLRDHIDADPSAFLGPVDAARGGEPLPALLVKLLDTAERLFVHFHPDDEFAGRHLGCRFGKTEAWYVVDTGPGSGEVFLGFHRAVAADEVRDWVGRQDAAAMLAAMNRVAVRPGDSLLVPGGLPHAIGAGVTLIELQEPTDLSILLEWSGYGVTRADADLGLGLDVALQALDRSAWGPERLETLRGTRAGVPTSAPVTRVLPPAADPYFRAELVDASTGIEIAADFSILIGLDGSATLTTDRARLDLHRGSVVLLPFAAGPARLAGDARLLRCRPPSAAPR